MKQMTTLQMKLTRAFWISGTYAKLKKSQISNDYLKHIIYFIAEGKGYYSFIHNKKRINRIFKEAYKRKLCRPDVIFTLHSWTLYKQGFTDHKPLYKITWDGQYERSN